MASERRRNAARISASVTRTTKIMQKIQDDKMRAWRADPVAQEKYQADLLAKKLAADAETIADMAGTITSSQYVVEFHDEAQKIAKQIHRAIERGAIRHVRIDH